MRRFVSFLILITILTGMATTEASHWVQVGESNFGPYYINSLSIKTGSDGSKEAWFEQEYQPIDCKSPLAIGFGKCISYLVTYEIYYPNKTVCFVQTNAYFTDGTVGTESFSCNPTSFPPEAVFAKRWNYLFR